MVEGTPGFKYNEEDVVAIKISDEIETVEFPIIRPWTHNNFINENTGKTPETLRNEPFSTLLQ